MEIFVQFYRAEAIAATLGRKFSSQLSFLSCGLHKYKLVVYLNFTINKHHFLPNYVIVVLDY